MNLKPSRVITIAINPACVKAAQVSASGVVEKLAKKAVEKGGVESAIRQALVGFETTKASILCIIPGDVATTKNIEVPSVDREEIESIIALQASRFTPFSKDEVLTSYTKLGSPKPNFTRVLLVVAKREAVKERLTWIKAAGLTVENVLFVPEATALFYAKASGATVSAAPVALLDMGGQSSNFMVLAQGALAMFRNIPVGTEQIVAGGDAAKKELVDGIKASVEAYEQEGIGPKPVQCYLTGDHPALAGFDVLFAESIGAKLAIIPYAGLVNGAKAVKDALMQNFIDESALDIIATGVTAARCEADLVPQEIKDHRAVETKGRETLTAGILTLAFLVLIGGGLISKVYFKDRFLKENLIAKYSAQRQEVQNLENLATKTRILRQYLEARALPLEALRELFRIIPPEIYLSSISKDEEGNVSIQGISESMSKVFGFVTALEESALFEGVKTKSTAAKKDRGKDVASFEIVMKIATEAAPKAESAPQKVDKK